GTLDGDCSSVANAVISKGQTIGQSFSCDCSVSRAVLWGKGSIIDLNAAIPPSSTLQLTETFNINDRGEIVGRGLPAGCDNHDTCGHLFLLIPCDEAGTHGCEGLAEFITAATPINPAPVARATQAPTTATENRPTPSEMVA